MSSGSRNAGTAFRSRRRPFPEVWEGVDAEEAKITVHEGKLSNYRALNQPKAPSSLVRTAGDKINAAEKEEIDEGDGRRAEAEGNRQGTAEEEEEEEEQEEKEIGNARREDQGDSASSSSTRVRADLGNQRPSKRHRPRRPFAHIKADILRAKTLVRRAQEEARLKTLQSSSTKWQRLLEGVCGGAGTLGTLASVGLLARKATGASTAFVALSALASFSFIWRGAVRRRGVEAAQRLTQLAALDDDPARIARLLDLLEADPPAFFRDQEVVALLSRAGGELILFREEALVEEALVGKVVATGSTAFLRQPHLEAITTRLHRSYPRLAQAMERSLLLEVGGLVPSQRPALPDLLDILSSWQWGVLVVGSPSLRRQLEEGLRKAFHAPPASTGDLVASLLFIDEHVDPHTLSLLRTRLPRAFAAYERGGQLLTHALTTWTEPSLSSFLEAYPSSLLLRRMNLSPAPPSSSSSFLPSPPSASAASSPFVPHLRRLWQEELRSALGLMLASLRHKEKGRKPPKGSTGASRAVANGGDIGPFDVLFEGGAWRLISSHRPSLDFLFLPPSPSSAPSPSPGLFHSLASRHAALVQAAKQDKERAESSSARKMREERQKWKRRTSGLEEELASATAKEAEELAPLLLEKSRVWAAINGQGASDASLSSLSSSPQSSLQVKMAALDDARARIRKVQDCAAKKREEIQRRMDETRRNGERAVRSARDMGVTKAAVSEGVLRVGREALVRELLREAGLIDP